MITGDDSPPVDNAAFLVDDGQVTAVGQAGELGLPPGAERVDLSGKVVMPALVSLHGHPGFVKGLGFDAENYTRDNIIDQLNRYAYYGVGTIVSLGMDKGDIAFDIRAEQEAGQLGGARLRTAGRGIADPDGGPFAPTLRPAAYGVTTEDEARQAVRELAERDVDAVKIWVDDRKGTVREIPGMKKTPIEVSTAVIDEAHLHDLQVFAHIWNAFDAAELVEAGIDGFAHIPRDRVPAELVAAIKRRDVLVMPNLAITERLGHGEPQAFLDDPVLHESVTPDVIARAKDTYTGRTADEVAQYAARYAEMVRNLAELRDAGVRLVLGADSGVTDQFFGYSELRELGLMVTAGLTPAEAIVAATSAPAAALGFDETGTITAGKSADFIVLNADPLEDIANVKQIDRVFLKGAEVDRASLRTGWTWQ